MINLILNLYCSVWEIMKIDWLNYIVMLNELNPMDTVSKKIFPLSPQR